MFPRLCFGCNVRLYRGEQILCAFCRNQLPLTEYSFNEENAVDRIFYGRTDIHKASSFLFYSEKGIVQNLIHNLKYRDQQEIGDFLGNWYGLILAESGQLKDLDYVVPVPLHKKKLKTRGYNQLTHFGKAMARHLKAEYIPDMLSKTANTRTQTRKRRFARIRNKGELYVLNAPRDLQDKHILLVDDVITTGATIEACANTLLNATDVRVSIASMTVVP